MRLPVSIALAALAAAALANEGPSTRVGDFRDFPAFPSTVLNNTRTISVLLPPSYDREPSRRYPVLYAEDAQNLFDEKTSFAGVEWRLDETLARLWEQKRIPEVIVVGISHAGNDRIAEFTPGPSGDRFVRFLATELKPFIDNRFRTKRGPADTAVMGSSMGGTISLWAVVSRYSVFGKAAALSPALQDTQPFEERLNYVSRPPIRVYLDIGTEELPGAQGRRLADQMEVLRSRLKSAGWEDGKDFVADVIEGGQHNEAAWAARVDRPLIFLFSPENYRSSSAS